MRYHTLNNRQFFIALGCWAALLVIGRRGLAGVESVGTTSANFLKIIPPARPAAMGEAFTALSDDEAGLLYNPGGAGDLIQGQVSATHIEWFQQFHLEHIGGVLQMEQGSAIGLNVSSFSTGDMLRTFRTGINSSNELQNFVQEGSFAPSDLSFGLSLAESFFTHWHAGMSLSLVQQTLDSQSAYGFNLDAGVLYTQVADILDLGLSVQHLGTQIQFFNEGSNEPFDARLGALLYLGPHWQLDADVVYSLDQKIAFNAGGEYWCFDLLALRAGYKAGGALNQWTAGAGIKLQDFHLDYAFVPYGDLGNTHRITASYDFGNPYITLKAQPDLLAPLGDFEYQNTYFSCRLPKRNRVLEWEIDLWDPNGSSVGKLSGHGPMPDKIAWDGRDFNGHLLPDESISASLSAKYPGGVRVHSNQAIVTLDSTPPTIELGSSSGEVQVGSDGKFSVPLHLSPSATDLHGVGLWKLEIKGPQGSLFKTFWGKGEVPEKGLDWDGRGDLSQTAKTGQVYTAVLYAKDKLGNWGKGKPMAFSVARKEIHLRLASDVLFTPGSAQLAEGLDEAFKEVVGQIRGSQKEITFVDVIGHTDNTPIRYSSFADNQELSLARAKAVVRFLVENFNLDPKIFRAYGRGDSEPVASNDNEDGRQANRRVDVIIHTKEYE